MTETAFSKLLDFKLYSQPARPPHHPYVWVLLKEVNQKFLDGGMGRVKSNLQSNVKKGRMTQVGACANNHPGLKAPLRFSKVHNLNERYQHCFFNLNHLVFF